MRIVITDCDYDSVAIEQEVVDAAGGTLVRHQATAQADVIAAARGADGLIVQYAPITADVLDALPSVRVISRYGVGLDTVDVDAATARGVAVCHVPDYGTEAVSDHAIALALAVTRGIGVLDRSLRAGSQALTPAQPIHQIAGSTFGVVGFGAIGGATARKASGLGYAVVVSDVTLEAGSVTDEGWRVLALDDLLGVSDVVSLHVPLLPATRHLIGAGALARMRPRAILVNTARGAIVDTDALASALERGTIHGAGLDVTDPEPLPADHPLTRHPRVVLTPHAAFYTEESYAELKRRTAQNAVDVLTGRQPRAVVNPQVLRRG